MALRHSLTRRDVVLVIIGAALMHIYSVSFFHSSDIVINTHLHDSQDAFSAPAEKDTILFTRTVTETSISTSTVTTTLPAETPQKAELPPIDSAPELPKTSIVYHAPGWTLFRNLYMANGTFFILSNNRSFPEIRLMTSTSLFAENNPENIAAREPTVYSMDYITPDQARTRWGEDTAKGHRNRVTTVEGNTLLVNEPHQFLRHYYHLVAELFFGVQAFWHGAFSKPSKSLISLYSLNPPPPPKLDRVIFAYSNADGWRDDPGFNRYFMRAAFPSLTVEVQEDWQDRVVVTSKGDRAWHFPLLLLTDRSASHRGVVCGSQTQRIAAEAWSFMKEQSLLMGEAVGGWWEPVRSSVLRYAGLDAPSDMSIYDRMLDVDADKEPSLPMPDKVVITYISRQSTHRRLTDESHQGLVDALHALRDRRGWEVNILQMEHLSKDEQLAYASRTTVMLGVHGNGLTHLIFMPPTRVSTVIEIFFPGGFAHDYQWTTRALGMKHFAVWNDTYRTWPDEPSVDYPDGFQNSYIPAHGESIARLIEQRVDGQL